MQVHLKDVAMFRQEVVRKSMLKRSTQLIQMAIIVVILKVDQSFIELLILMKEAKNMKASRFTKEKTINKNMVLLQVVGQLHLQLLDQQQHHMILILFLQRNPPLLLKHQLPIILVEDGVIHQLPVGNRSLQGIGIQQD